MASNRESMPDQCKRNTFTSYVAPPPGDLTANEWCLPSDMRDVQLAKPRLLTNEQIVVCAPAYMYSTITPNITELQEAKQQQQIYTRGAVFGLLSVTNFKLAFVPLHQQQPASLPASSNYQRQQQAFSSDLYQEQFFLQRNEVTLNNIDVVYMITPNGKRKKLEPQTKNIGRRIAALHIICMNFRLLKFAFQLQDNDLGGAHDHGKRIASALALFAYPTRHVLSFAYRYNEAYYSTLKKSDVTMFTSKNDWARELIRCGATEWQVVSTPLDATAAPFSPPFSLQQNQRINTGNSLYSLPPNFVIPKCCSIERYLELSRAFCDNRAAFWVYSYHKASLVRLAELNVSAGGQQQDTKLENITLELVRKCDDQRLLKLLQLTDHLPRIHEVQRAFVKFRRLCTPETLQQFVMQESKFLTLLEKSNWLFYVSLCLSYACEAARNLRASVTCVLQETNGRDLCCVVSSLTQMILDPNYRTIDGFQSLVQKEWVALEHPFQKRLGHVYLTDDVDTTKTDEAQSPVFLLFLDCVWQLQQQFPDEFEFTQTYLTTLWDSCFLPIFDTFQFDTERDRANAVREHKIVLRPVWDWSEQFNEKDKLFFSNPLYQRQRYNDNKQQQAPQVQPRRNTQNANANANANRNTHTHTHAHASGQTNIVQRQTFNQQLFTTQSSVPKDRYLEPQHRISDIAIWEQCYYRWLPVLEITGGGQPCVDLYHRLLLSNIAKLQRCVELQEFTDLPDVYYELTGESRASSCSCSSSCTVESASMALTNYQEQLNSSIEYIDGVEKRQKPFTTANTNAIDAALLVNTDVPLPVVSSYFPFGSGNSQAPQTLIDVLTDSNEMLLEGSIMDRISIA